MSGDATICAGTSTMVTVMVAGGVPPYSVTLGDGGGTQTGSGPLSFTVSPSGTTTYAVASGMDSKSCPITGSGSATVTVTQNPTTSNAGPDQTPCVTTPATPAAYSPTACPELSVVYVADTQNHRVEGRPLASPTWQLIGTPNNVGSTVGRFHNPSKIR